MNVKVTFEQRVTSYVSLPQGAESVCHVLVRDHGERCDHPDHSNHRGERDHHVGEGGTPPPLASEPMCVYI